jgi:hypothetical protein
MANCARPLKLPGLSGQLYVVKLLKPQEHIQRTALRKRNAPLRNTFLRKWLREPITVTIPLDTLHDVGQYTNIIDNG